MAQGTDRSRSGWARAAGAVAGAAAVGAALWAVKDVPSAVGGVPRGPRKDRMQASPRFADGRFHNPVAPSGSPVAGGATILRDLLRGREHRTPAHPIPVVTPFGPAATGGLHITWYGHASTLVEIEGRRVLFDPVWSERCSPSRLVGPRRLHQPPIALAGLPPLDAIVISHDHYDHLDEASVRELARTQDAPFLVPLGIGAHLEAWRVPPDRIIELDWNEHIDVAGVRFTATAARHFSGRRFTRDTTLWASWVVAGPTRKVFYTGDTGYFGGFAAIGAEHGPFDASLVQCGAYGAGWPDIHMTPEDAVSAHVDVQGGLLVPVHWCTFVLAFHDWSEPVERLCRAADSRGVPVAVPRPGQRVDVDTPPPLDNWWSTVS